jgi:hypothetical protein
MIPALILLLLAGAHGTASDRISEESAVSQLKRTPAYQLDGSLPNRPFGSWVNDKFRNWDVQWELHACGEVTDKIAKRELGQEGPVCVQVNIMQPGQKVHSEASDGFQLLFLVGTEKKGFMTPRLRLVTHTDGKEVEKLQDLSEVEP